MRKKFKNEYFNGRVISFDPVRNWYRVRYEDGDYEDCDVSQMEDIVCSGPALDESYGNGNDEYEKRNEEIPRNEHETLPATKERNEFEPVELSELTFQDIRSSQLEFSDFERDVNKALLLFHLNTGIAHFDKSDRN